MREAGLLDTAPDASLGPLFGRADEGASPATKDEICDPGVLLRVKA